MGDSSDEEINFDDEQIDLMPLWQDSPFSNNNEPDEHETTIEPSNDNNHASRVIELSPLSAPEAVDPLESLMNEINIMSRRVNNARIAHQRLMEGRPESVEEEPSVSSSNQQLAWTYSRGSASRYPPPTPIENEPVRNQRMVYRFSQLRHMPTGSSNRPNWSRGRQTFTAVNAGNRSGMNRLTGSQPEDEVRFEDADQPEYHFILPQAIAERERGEEIDDSTRAERALFVSQLLLSSLTIPSDVLSEAVKKAKAVDKKNKMDSKKGDGASTSGTNSEKLNSATGSEGTAEDAESSVKIPSDLNEKN